MSTLIVDVSDPRRLADGVELQKVQEQISAIKLRYADSTLAFKALDLAWEATRAAWYAIAQENDDGKLNRAKESLDWCMAHLDRSGAPVERESRHGNG